MAIKLTIKLPKPNAKWWQSSKKEVLNIVEEYNKEAWRQEKDPVTGNKWKPRQQPTGSHPLLKKSGKMQNSTVFKPTSKPMMFNAVVKVPYGGFHQRGTSKMPQRRWLGIGSDITPKLVPVFRKHLFKGSVTYTTS